MKDQIIALRMDGFSIQYISTVLNISKSTVSKYCRGLRQNNINNGSVAGGIKTKLKWEEERNNIRNKAEQQWTIIKNDPLLLGLVAFYWGEGWKRTKADTGDVRITNSDPGLIKISKSAIEKLGYHNFSATVLIFPSQSFDECKIFWSALLGINVVVKNNRKPSDNHKLYSKYGVCCLRVNKSFTLWHSLMVWIDKWRIDNNVYESGQL